MPRTLLAIAPALLLIALGAPATAQDLDDDLEPEVPAPQVIVRRANGWNEQVFERRIFTNSNEPAIRTRLLSTLAIQVEELDRSCHLTDAQVARLELAGRGDVKHLFDRVAAMKRKFLAVKDDAQKISDLLREIRPIQDELASGPFAEGSLFFKAARSTLDTAQAEALEANLRDRRKARHKARVELSVALLDNAVGFRGDQRAKLVQMLLERTEPPRRSDQYDHYIVLWQLANLPEEAVRPLLDETQWKLLTRQIDGARNLEPFLRQNGYLDGLLNKDRINAPGPKK